MSYGIWVSCRLCNSEVLPLHLSIYSPYPSVLVIRTSVPLAVQQWLADALSHVSTGLSDTFITVVRFKIPVKSIFFKFSLENIWRWVKKCVPLHSLSETTVLGRQVLSVRSYLEAVNRGVLWKFYINRKTSSTGSGYSALCALRIMCGISGWNERTINSFLG